MCWSVQTNTVASSRYLIICSELSHLPKHIQTSKKLRGICSGRMPHWWRTELATGQCSTNIILSKNVYFLCLRNKNVVSSFSDQHFSNDAQCDNRCVCVLAAEILKKISDANQRPRRGNAVEFRVDFDRIRVVLSKL